MSKIEPQAATALLPVLVMASGGRLRHPKIPCKKILEIFLMATTVCLSNAPCRAETHPASTPARWSPEAGGTNDNARQQAATSRRALQTQLKRQRALQGQIHARGGHSVIEPDDEESAGSGGRIVVEGISLFSEKRDVGHGLALLRQSPSAACRVFKMS